jgi:PAS domain S-box-containing protein
MPTSVHNGFRESEEGYRLLFESNPHAMWIYDRDTLNFLAVNDSAIHHYGYSRQEFLNMTLKDIRPSKDISSLLEKVSQIKPGMNSASSRHVKKDGTLIEVEIVSHTLDFNGRPAELVLAMNVTQSEQNGSHEKNNYPSNTSESFEDEALTEAEKRVARYVARGFSNKQIAKLLGVSSRTIENHISHILLKKSFENRVQIARHVFGSSQDPIK